MKQIYKCVEPFVVHIRSGNNSDMKNAMIKSLTTEHGYVHVDVEAAVRGEAERGTMVGQELTALIGNAQIPTNEIITSMLSKILYCGKDGLNKFILSSYPGTNDQAEFFEKNCTSLSAIVYPTVGGEATVNLKNKDLGLFNLDSKMYKDFRLKIMTEWSNKNWDDTINGKV